MIPKDNLRRVAIVVSVLPQDEARQLMMALNEHQVSAVLREISLLRHMPLNERVPVLTDFVKSHMQHSTDEASIAPTVDRTIRYDRPVAPPAFGFLKDVPSDRIAEELGEEQPHTVAVVLAHMAARQASRVLALLPEALRAETVQRLADLGPTDRDVIREIEGSLEARLLDCVNRSIDHLGGVHFVADVLRETDPETEHRLLDHISNQDPDLGSEIKRSVHRFSDIFLLPDRDLRMLLRHVETAQWAVALRGVEQEQQQRVVSNLEPVVASSLRQQMDWLGPVRQETVERVRNRILVTMRRLRNAKILGNRPTETVEAT